MMPTYPEWAESSLVRVLSDNEHISDGLWCHIDSTHIFFIYQASKSVLFTESTTNKWRTLCTIDQIGRLPEVLMEHLL